MANNSLDLNFNVIESFLNFSKNKFFNNFFDNLENITKSGFFINITHSEKNYDNNKFDERKTKENYYNDEKEKIKYKIIASRNQKDLGTQTIENNLELDVYQKPRIACSLESNVFFVLLEDQENFNHKILKYNIHIDEKNNISLSKEKEISLIKKLKIIAFFDMKNKNELFLGDRETNKIFCLDVIKKNLSLITLKTLDDDFDSSYKTFTIKKLPNLNLQNLSSALILFYFTANIAKASYFSFNPNNGNIQKLHTFDGNPQNKIYNILHFNEKKFAIFTLNKIKIIDFENKGKKFYIDPITILENNLEFSKKLKDHVNKKDKLTFNPNFPSFGINNEQIVLNYLNSKNENIFILFNFNYDEKKDKFTFTPQKIFEDFEKLKANILRNHLTKDEKPALTKKKTFKKSKK